MTMAETVKGIDNNRFGSDRHRYLSLLDLALRIVEDSDRQALEEFHNRRTPFRYKQKSALRFTAFLNIIQESPLARRWAGSDGLVLDKAYDLTVSKFSNLPNTTPTLVNPEKKSKDSMKRPAMDCRFYFKAFIRSLEKKLVQPPMTQLERENLEARTLQSLVTRHFYLSCLEARRQSQDLATRYFWRVKDGTICLWLPVSLTGQHRQKWLQRNIEDPDPSRPLERRRIQKIVDDRLFFGRVFSFDEFDNLKGSSPAGRKTTSEEISVKGLSAVVAEEKAENIHRLRPAVKILGPENLKAMVLRIFDDLSAGRYDDGKIAASYGLSKATFSRFAGSRWHTSAKKHAWAIPDLWRNTAGVLAGCPTFTEAAKQAGVWDRVLAALDLPNPGQRRSKNDE